jgi:Leucine-rich repeat (LRR) protein
MLHMWDLGTYGTTGRTWLPGAVEDHPAITNALAPTKTLEYHRASNQTGPEPKLVHNLTKPYGVIFSHANGPWGQEAVGGLAMRLELEAGLRVDVFWPGTGPIIPEERVALKQLFKESMHYFQQWPWIFGSSGGLSYADFLADDDIDPCLHRLYDTTCIGGHIVSFSHAFWWTRRLPCNAFEILSKFTKLTRMIQPHPAISSFAFTCSPNEKALVPCSFWQLKDMVYLEWIFEPHGAGVDAYAELTPFHFETCAEEIGSMPNLVYADFVCPGATGKLPFRLFQSPKLEAISVQGIQLGDLPSLNQMPNLRKLVLIDNGIEGPFPSLANQGLLQEVIIQRNSLQDAVGGTASCFNNCSKLTSVKITDTAITELFTFIGSTKVEFIDLSHNSIRSTIPQTWGSLTGTKTLDLSYNAIPRINTNYGSSGYVEYSPLRGMLSLKSVDLSHNEIADQDHDTKKFMANLFPTVEDVTKSIQHIDLSYNKIYSDEEVLVTVGLGEKLGGLVGMLSFAYHHNRVAGVLSLFDSDTCKLNFDVSYNKISGITMGTNNPCAKSYSHPTEKYGALMRMDMSNQVSGLPRFLSLSHGAVVAVNNQHQPLDSLLAGAEGLKQTPFVPSNGAPFQKVEYPKGSSIYPFSCTKWVVRQNPSGTVDLDPDFYEYTGGSTPELRMKWFDENLDGSYESYNTSFGGSDGFCKCDLPYAGTPPNCIETCGQSNFAKSPGVCEQCSRGVDCSGNQQELQNLQLLPDYWRISPNSTSVYRCAVAGACVGGQIADFHGAGYCAENHEGRWMLKIVAVMLLLSHSRFFSFRKQS